MVVESAIVSQFIPIQKKIQKKVKEVPIPKFSEKILKAEAKRKAKESEILQKLGQQKAKKAALMAKNCNINLLSMPM